MPEDSTKETDLDQLLDDLEDYTLNARNYQTLHETLDLVEHIPAPSAEKLLLLCIRDSLEDLKYTTHLLNIILTLLKKIKNGQCSSLTNLVPSALAVLSVLHTTSQCDKLDSLKTLCFDIINSYPDETLISLCVNHSEEILKVIESYCKENTLTPAEIRFQSINIVGKLLRILPPDKKQIFVKDGIDIWFSHVIPLVVKQTATNDSSIALNLLDNLELLVDELVQFDYVKRPSWQEILQNIHTPSRYPATMKSLLESGCTYWHRLWIIFIKLLKDQITRCTNTTASPINSVLPSVELAFKMDVRNRCRAFLCWNILIENFSKETNEAFLNKRLKLLIVPLASNNAKVEETALAKFKSWWHLITCFQEKLDKIIDAALFPFLTFCFGKPGTSGLIPGKISDETKIQCAQAFINIIGHTQCEGCVPLPKLNVRIFNIKPLVNHWKHWIHCLNNVIRICIELKNEFTEKQIKCVWISFIVTIGELPKNNIRRDLLNEVLMLLEGLTQDCDNQLMGVMVNLLIPALFDDEIEPLLKSKDDNNEHMYKIAAVLNKLPLDSLQDRKTVLASMKFVTNWIVNDALETSSNMIEWLVQSLSSNSVLLWTSLAESISVFMYNVCPMLLAKMLLWPFNYLNSFVNKEESTTAWLNLYKTLRPYLQIKTVHKELVHTLMTHADNQSSCVFVLNATIAILEHKLQLEDFDLGTEVELILQLTSKVNRMQMKMILPSLAGIIVNILESLNKNINATIAEHVIFIICNILKICKLLFEDHSYNENEITVKYIESIFNSLKPTFKLDVYSKLKSNLVDQLKECAPYLKHDKLLSNHIITIYETNLNETNKDFTDNIAVEVAQAFKIVEEPNSVNIIANEKQNAVKKSKEASIVNTVTENGEEFVVIKSHWKLNPRKLTENQKEKLQRRREDIPAMYQDLSQSQDDFKITTWKTDSQDTSTTSSKSTNIIPKEDVSLILKNIPNSEFFPKIIETVAKKPITDVTQKTELTKEKLKVSNDKSLTIYLKNIQHNIENVKSPRIALKDRVFRNVRNLIERSNLSPECKDVPDNVLKTPLIAKVKPSTNVTNSAPSLINSERPTRIKRKPKKFDDLELISLTKRRHSLSTTDSQSDGEIAENKVDITKDAKIIADVEITHDEDSKIMDQSISENTVNDRLKEKVNDDVKKEEEILRLDSKNVHLPTQIINKNNDNVRQISDPRNSNSVHKSVHDPIKEKILEINLPSDKESITPRSNKSKIKVEKRNSINCKSIALSSLKVENKDCIKLNEKYSTETETDVLPMLSDIKKNEEGDEKSCHDDMNKSIIQIKVSIDNTETLEESQNTVDLTASKSLNKQKLSSKKTNTKKSRIESQLAIDMVEGHPFLKTQSEKRSTRKIVSSPSVKRKRLSFNTDNSKIRKKGSTKIDTKTKDKSKSVQDNSTSQDICTSQDFIESSQDSSVTTISVKSAKPAVSKKTAIASETLLLPKDSIKTDTQNLIDVPISIDLTDIESTDDIEMPCNKTDLVNHTEEMDAEPIDRVILSKDLSIPEVVSLDTDTQNTAEADTEPVNVGILLDLNVTNTSFEAEQNTQFTENQINEVSEEITFQNKTSESLMTTTEDITKTLSESVLLEAQKDDSGTSCNNEQRKKDFLNNTLQISPIKSMSPVREEKSLSPETSSDYVVIKLASPVQTNGLPFEPCVSPEIFTEDKLSPDKRDRSPPREEISIKNTSPRSLSLKKNRPQMRPGGRAAQMLGLCVPDRQQTIMVSEKLTDIEEAKRSPSLNTSARRNLRILYNSANGESNESSENTDDSESFLKFKRALPAIDCSPSGPILKRKLIDITDESTTSPASKRKRVSFHDPPVSTTICVKKYIEPISIRSPQNSTTKRLERQMRAQTAVKSPRRLDNAFKLDSVLTKAVESFSEAPETQAVNEDTEMSSLDETPVVEVIKTSDLNDTDPICKDLADCEDHISNIAAELSSPAMKALLVKKLEGKVETIGDLAKMTELEVNRLCIKAPKVQVAKKVLNEYLLKLKQVNDEITPTVEAARSESTILEAKTSVEIQTDGTSTGSCETQTDCVAISLASCQTDAAVTSDTFVQTNESGNKSTADIITECLSEKPDFIEELCEKIDDTSKKIIAKNLSHATLIKIITDKISNGDGKHVLSILQDQLVARLECKDLILFCSSLLKKVYDKPA